MNYLSWIISVVSAVYLFIDAKKHGKSPWLWAILGFFFSFITLSVYFFKTNRKGLGILFLVLFILLLVFYIVLIASVLMLASSGNLPS